MAAESMKLSGVTTLIVDNDHYGVRILTQMLRGLGLDAPKVVGTAAEAQAILTNYCYDLCICEAELSDMPGADLVRWIRKQKPPIRFMPILILTGYSFMRNITSVRDAGAHIVVKKPLSPQVLYDHIAWAANPTRPFIDCDRYVGPDRRFKFLEPSEGANRRNTDTPPESGDAVVPDMSPRGTGASMKPTEISAG
jgi:CheY-like chemotaxis protein